MQEEKKYEQPDVHGFALVPVLPYLNGKPWDNMARNFIHSLRPSKIRITNGAINLDSTLWRVTVFLKKDGKTINRIEQEVEVGLEDCRDAMDLRIYMG